MKKKIIVILSICVCICNLLCSNVFAVGSIKLVLNNDVEGTIDEDIETQNVEITFDEPDEYFFNTAEFYDGMDVTDWFTNIPDDCDYLVTVYDVTDTKLTVTFEGNVGSNATVTDDPIPIEITIPNDEYAYYVLQGINPYINDISNVDNSNAHYVINEPEPITITIRYRGPYEVKGTVGEQIDPQIVEVELIDCPEEFLPDILNTTLPTVNGLTPTITSVDLVNGKYLTITYTGTPLEESQDLIHTTILKQYLKLNDIDRIVPDRNDVKFNIIAKREEDKPTPTIEDDDEPIKTIFIAPKTGIN